MCFLEHTLPKHCVHIPQAKNPKHSIIPFFLLFKNSLLAWYVDICAWSTDFGNGCNNPIIILVSGFRFFFLSFNPSPTFATYFLASIFLFLRQSGLRVKKDILVSIFTEDKIIWEKVSNEKCRENAELLS